MDADAVNRGVVGLDRLRGHGRLSAPRTLRSSKHSRNVAVGGLVARLREVLLQVLEALEKTHPVDGRGGEQLLKGLEFEAAFFVGVDVPAERMPELLDKHLYPGAEGVLRCHD